MTAFKLSDSFIIEVTGKDAQRYLQARLTNDIARLAPQASCLAAALTPQGKTEALFSVLRLSPDSFLLLCDGGDRSEVLAAFRRYIVADRVTTQFIAGQIVHSDEQQSSEFPSVVRFRGTPSCKDVIVREAVTSTITAEEYKRARYRAAVPVFPDELSGLFFPEAGLREAIAFGKGCYCGQEAIERVDAIGELPRNLLFATIQSEAPPDPTAPILTASGERAGKIVGSIVDGNVVRLCVLVRSELVSHHESLFVAEKPLTLAQPQREG